MNSICIWTVLTLVKRWEVLRIEVSKDNSYTSIKLLRKIIDMIRQADPAA